MRIALISDIHGNLVSLEAVLAHLSQQSPDRVIFLGDIATMGPQPRQVIARIRDLGCDCIVGNHDLYLIDPLIRAEKLAAMPAIDAMISWCISEISGDDLAFVHSFSPTLEVPLSDAITLLCAHGSPRSAFDFLLATVPPAEVDTMLDGHLPTLLAVGHTHVQMLRQHNGCLIVNPGAVGSPFLRLPFEKNANYMPWAEYAIVDAAGEEISIALRRIPIDVEAVLAPARGNPHIRAWTDSWSC